MALKTKQVLLEENQMIKEVTKLKSIVERFTLSFEKLKMILDSQQAMFDKIELGYNPLLK